LLGPSGYFPFGTDSIGRDIFARVLYGGRLSLAVAFPSVGLALALGLLLGLAAGYLGGRADALIMRGLDIFFAFPALLLAMLMVTVLGASLRNLILTIGIIYAPRMARIIRAPTIAVKEREFIEAARTIGCPPLTIILRHLLPNIASPIVVEVTLALGQVILTETALSFLGLGPPPPDPTWGAMVSQSRQFMEFAPWAVLAPGGAIILTTASFLLIGQGLRALLDPRQQRR
jgi:ABC-type dipeptide/oligopeptide/nickel transport system permease subunit